MSEASLKLVVTAGSLCAVLLTACAEKNTTAQAPMAEATTQPKATAAQPSGPPPPASAAPAPVRPAASAPATRSAIKVQFGIMPGNYDEEDSGVLVEEVIPGTSAEDAGIRADDRLVSWNGKPVKSVENWMEHLGAAKPGDVVEVGVVRGGKTIPIKVILKARRE